MAQPSITQLRLENLAGGTNLVVQARQSETINKQTKNTKKVDYFIIAEKKEK